MIRRQPNPPSQRRNDDLETGKRGGDIKITFPFGWGSYEGDGRLFATIVASIVAPVVIVAGIVYHDMRTAGDHQTLVRAIYLNTYVMSLTEPQRQALDLREPEEIRRLRRYRDETAP